MPRPLGVYVHFPYCTHRCPYCDFAVTTEAVPGERRYARAVLAELALRAPAFDGLAPVSLYLGGGTPSLWDPDEVADVIAAIRERLRFPSDAEVTIEANPESCDRERLRRLRAARPWRSPAPTRRARSARGRSTSRRTSSRSTRRSSPRRSRSRGCGARGA